MLKKYRNKEAIQAAQFDGSRWVINDDWFRSEYEEVE